MLKETFKKKDGVNILDVPTKRKKLCGKEIPQGDQREEHVGGGSVEERKRG